MVTGPRTAVQLALEHAMGVLFRSKLLDREMLRETTASAGGYYPFGSEERVTIPTSDEAQIPAELRSVTGTRTVERPFVCELTDAVLAGPQPLVRTHDGYVVLESADADRDVFEHRAVELLRRLGTTGIRFLRGQEVPIERRFRHVFPLVWHATTNYYHWLLTDLIKLRALRAYRDQTARCPQLLVDGDAPSWVFESLEHLGVDAEKCTSWTGGLAAAETLVLPYHRQTMGELETSPDDCRWLRRQALRGLNTPPARQDRRLFVSRSDADCRRVQNRPAVQSLLEGYGFETYRLTDHSFAEQVRLFAEAEAVVAPHGAGLTNTVFGTGLSVFELLPDDDVQTMYFQLAHQLGHEYDHLLCERRGDDIVVDIDPFRERLDRLLE